MERKDTIVLAVAVLVAVVFCGLLLLTPANVLRAILNQPNITYFILMLILTPFAYAFLALLSFILFRISGKSAFAFIAALFVVVFFIQAVIYWITITYPPMG